MDLEDGRTEAIEGPVLIVAITVGPSIGGGFLVSPDARPDDGFLDLFLVEKLGLGKVLRYLPGILRGSLRGKAEVHQARVRRVEIHPTDERAITFELDGELMGDETSFLEIQVLPQCLPVLGLTGEAG
jgi:diacylglycerol kinase (ATP)